MQVLELKGIKSYRALIAFHSLMLGLKMLPAYMSESYEDFFDRLSQMSEDDQETMIREAVLFVELEQAEIEAMLSFCLDPNGVPYGPASLKNLGPDQIMEGIVSVAKEMAKIKIDFVPESQKKN